jgi:predicted DNA-binding protein
MDRPQKLDGDNKKYSFLAPRHVLEALNILARQQHCTTATLMRRIVEDYVMGSATFRERPAERNGEQTAL